MESITIISVLSSSIAHSCRRPAALFSVIYDQVARRSTLPAPLSAPRTGCLFHCSAMAACLDGGSVKAQTLFIIPIVTILVVFDIAVQVVKVFVCSALKPFQDSGDPAAALRFFAFRQGMDFVKMGS